MGLSRHCITNGSPLEYSMTCFVSVSFSLSTCYHYRYHNVVLRAMPMSFSSVSFSPSTTNKTTKQAYLHLVHISSPSPSYQSPPPSLRSCSSSTFFSTFASLQSLLSQLPVSLYGPCLCRGSVVIIVMPIRALLLYTLP